VLYLFKKKDAFNGLNASIGDVDVVLWFDTSVMVYTHTKFIYMYYIVYYHGVHEYNHCQHYIISYRIEIKPSTIKRTVYRHTVKLSI